MEQTLDEHFLNEMVGAIVREVNPERIYLFGSRSREDARPDSDVDFLVVERQPFTRDRSRLKELTRIRRALASFRLPKDILVYSEEEVDRWRGSLNHIVARCLQEGRLVYERS